jgi:photosystem II stability/assembly factor-like uncharacterized protein
LNNRYIHERGTNPIAEYRKTMNTCKYHVLLPIIIVAAAAAIQAVAASPATTPLSGTYVWSNVKIVAGGFVPGIEPSPVQADLIYARTDMGGAYRWDQAHKSWTPLTDWAGGADANLLGIESIAPDPIDPKRVYIEVGTYTGDFADNGAVLRSNDQGRTFQRTNLQFKVGGNENGRSMGERLAVDPAKPSILFLGSRKAGLWQSSDYGATFSKVTAFPVADDRSGIGISFVVFDAVGVHKGEASHNIYVGATNSPTPLYHSADGGITWNTVPGQPAGMMPQQSKIDKSGNLYITYTNSPGPNGVTGGAVWKYDTNALTWTDITPIHPSQNGASGFGYAGLSLDPQHPGTLVVSTLDCWNPGDNIYRTSDSGHTWHGLRERSQRDISASPWLTFGKSAATFGWWLGSVAIDPFHPQHLLYGTGATIWSCWDAATTSQDQATHWAVGGQGIEETAVLSLASPPTGPHLISGVGDIGGFIHSDVNVSPPGGMFTNPIYTNTNNVEFAGKAPNIVVRSGGRTPAYSTDSGETWSPVNPPAQPGGGGGGFRRGGAGSLTVNADGTVFFMSSSYSTDKGATWQLSQGLIGRVGIIADRVDPKVFYALGGANLLISKDGGVTFTQQSASPVGGGKLYAAPEHAGDLWISAGGQGLFHSADYGVTFTKIDGAGDVEALGFGKAAPGNDYPALYYSGRTGRDNGIFRSIDKGATWIRINDNQHQYGLTSLCITGDPRIFGRVYFGTNGRGIVMGDIAAKSPAVGG